MHFAVPQYATNARGYGYQNDWTPHQNGKPLHAKRFAASPAELAAAREQALTAQAKREARQQKSELFDAITRRDHATCARLLQGNPALLERHTSFGSTPLGLAAAVGDAAIVGLFLAAGANVLAADGIGATPLIMACYKGHIEVVKLLLGSKQGGPAGRAFMLRQCTRRGESALMAAAKAGHVAIVSLLLAEGADAHACDTEGRDAMMLACRHNKVDTAQLLMSPEVGLSPERRDAAGRTALMHAAAGAALQVVQALLALHPPLDLTWRDFGSPPGHVPPCQPLASPSASPSRPHSSQQRLDAHALRASISTIIPPPSLKPVAPAGRGTLAAALQGAPPAHSPTAGEWLPPGEGVGGQGKSGSPCLGQAEQQQQQQQQQQQGMTALEHAAGSRAAGADARVLQVLSEAGVRQAAAACGGLGGAASPPAGAGGLVVALSDSMASPLPHQQAAAGAPAGHAGAFGLGIVADPLDVEGGARLLYLAAEAGNVACVSWLLERRVGAQALVDLDQALPPSALRTSRVYGWAAAGVYEGLGSDWGSGLGDSSRLHPMFAAVRSGNEQVVDVLLRNGARIDVRDSRGRTPLAWAACHGLDRMVQCLVARGAALTASDNHGQVPRQLAHVHGRTSTEHLLTKLARQQLLIDDSALEAERQAEEQSGHEAVAALQPYTQGAVSGVQLPWAP